MNNIQINIYSSTVKFTKLFLDLDKQIITLNQKEIKLNSLEFLAIMNRIMEVAKTWDTTELIDSTEYQKIELSIHVPPLKNEYIFEQSVPSNINEIYSLIKELEVKSYE